MVLSDTEISRILDSAIEAASGVAASSAHIKSTRNANKFERLRNDLEEIMRRNDTTELLQYLKAKTQAKAIPAAATAVLMSRLRKGLNEAASRE